MFLRGGQIDNGAVQRSERGSTVGVVAAGPVTVKAGKIDGSMVSTFPGCDTEKRTRSLGRNPNKPRVECRIMGDPRQTNLFENAGHIAQQT